MSSNPAIDRITTALRTQGIRTELEYKFLTGREFRFDVVVTHYRNEDMLKNGIKIALEYEGGIFVNGRHTRPTGYAKDTEKYNLATINGWRVLRYTPIAIKIRNSEYLIADDVVKLIEQIKSEKTK